MAGPYNVCNNSAASGVATLTQTVGSGSPTGSSAAAGDLVYLLAGVSGAINVTGVTDTKGNTYHNVAGPAGSGQHCEIWASLTTAALVAGTDTITVTWGSTSSAKFMIVRGCTGVTSATPDKVNQGSGTSTAPTSGTTGTLSQANELVVGGIQDAAAGGAPTGLSFGTGITLTNSAFSTEFDEIVTATTAQTASGTITSAAWCAVVASFPYTPPAAGLTPYLIGSNDIASGLSLTVTPAVVTSPGDAIIVAGSSSTPALPTGVTDTQGNTYTLAGSVNAIGPAAFCYAALGAKSLGTSDTITIAWANTAPAKTAFAVGCSGFSASVSLDITTGAQGSSAAPSLTSASLEQPNELGFAVIANGSGGGAPTGITSGWTQQGSGLQAPSAQWTSVYTDPTSAVTALTAAATISSAVSWSVLIVTLTGPAVQAQTTYSEAFCYSVAGGVAGAGALQFPETFHYSINTTVSYRIVNTWSYDALSTYGMDSIPIANTTGNGLVVFIGWNGTDITPVSSVADDSHNFWSHGATSGATGDVRCAIWVCPNAQAATNLSIGLSWFAQAVCVLVAEVSGFPQWASFDVTASAVANTGGTITPAGTASAADVAFTCMVNEGTSGNTSGPQGWNAVNSVVRIDGPDGTTDPASTRLRAFWEVAQPGALAAQYTVPGGIPAAACLVALRQVPVTPVQLNQNWPGVHVEMAFGYAPGDPTAVPVWTDVTSRLIGQSGDTEITATRGRQYESESAEAGDLTVQLNNADGALTPGNAASPYGPGAVQLGTPVRVWATWGGRAYAVAYGYTERIPQTWPDPQWGQVPWEAPDALDPLSNSQLPSAFAGELLTDEPYMYIPCGETYLQDGSSGLPLANLSRTNQRPMIAMDGVTRTAPNQLSYSRLETGQAWFTNIYGGIVTYTAAGAQGQGLNGDPGTAAIGVTSIAKAGVAQTYTGGAFYAAPDIPSPFPDGITIEFWAIIPGIAATSNWQELLRVSGPANNYFVGSANGSAAPYGRGARFLVRVNPGPSGTFSQDFLSITLADFEGNSDGWGFTGTFTDRNPHHFVFVIGLDPSQVHYVTQVYVDGTQRATRTSAGVNVEEDWGYIGLGGLMHYDGGISWGAEYTIGHFAMYDEALTEARIAAHYAAGSTGGAGDDTVTQVAKLLVWGGFGLPRASAPASPSPLMGPADQIQGQSVADAASQIATTDGGMFYVDAAGNVTWWPRSFLMDRPVKWTLGDGPGEIPYLPDQAYDYDNTFVDNLITSQRVINSSGDGALATVASLPSQQQYFTRSSLQETVETTSDEDAYDQANWLGAKYSQPALRVQQVVLDPASNPVAWPAALGIEQGDIVQLNRRPLGGAAISQTCIVQQVAHKAGPDSWQVTVNMIPYDIEAAVLQCDASGYNVVSGNGVGW